MQKDGLDSRRSWVVAGACFVVQFLTFGLTETSGLMYVAAVERFNTSRGKASIPFTLAYCVRSAIGPLIGLLGGRFGIRLITLFGAILSSITVGACFFAEDILEFIILWGILFGISLGCETALLCVIINEHFVKNRVKANGLNVSGASIGILHYLVETYGLSGTVLITSGLMLNSVPAVVVMLINKPKEEELPDNSERNLIQRVSIIDRRVSLQWNSAVDIGRKRTDSRFDSPECDRVDEVCNQPATETKIQPTSLVALEVSRLQGLPTRNYQAIEAKAPGLITKIWSNKRTYHVTPVGAVSQTEVEEDDTIHCQLTDRMSYDSIFTRRMSTNFSIKLKNQNILTETLNSSAQNKKPKGQFQRLVCDPIYIFIVIGCGIYYFSITSMYTIIVDYATDIGVSKQYSTYVLMWIAISDLCWFPFHGWLIERGFLDQSLYAAFSFLGMSLTTTAMVFCPGYIVLLVLMSLFELSQCGVIILTAPLVAQYMEADLHATGIASVTILSSPMTLAISPLVAFFRDNGGSYAGVFFCHQCCHLLVLFAVFVYTET